MIFVRKSSWNFRSIERDEAKASTVTRKWQNVMIIQVGSRTDSRDIIPRKRKGHHLQDSLHNRNSKRRQTNRKRICSSMLYRLF